MWKSLILAIMGEKINLMDILYNTENFFLSLYLIKIVGKSRFLSKQKRVLLYLWDIMNEIMLRFDIKMRKIYVHSPFNKARRPFFSRKCDFFCVNFILEISKYKFQRPQLYLAAASRRSWRSAGKRRRMFMKF